MSKALRTLTKNISAEREELSEAGRKRSLWGNIGMGIGGFLGMAATGGTATPFIAALKSGFGTLAGGGLFDALAKQHYKIKGGRFFQEERRDLISQLRQKIGAGALKSGLLAGTTAYKGLKKAGKGIGDIFKPQTEKYWEDILTKAGTLPEDLKTSLLDFHRSPLSRFLNPTKTSNPYAEVTTFGRD